MCCRYYYDLDGVQNDIEDLGLKPDILPSLPEGEIGPGRDSVIIMGKGGLLGLDTACWGFPGREKDLIINARSESVLARPMFSSSAMSRRCAVPAFKFYEWDPDRQLAEFRDPARDIMYLAGLWKLYGEELRFVVMTTEANESVSAVHERMPLMIEKADLRRWILDPSSMQALMDRPMPKLSVYREEQQLSLF